ncbi:PIG-L family deacetylase [Caldivirga sp.]|uniref:PIG-L deacetylase family protein n=1 Tax=Caldivirga sp. TaxID=2080243 RepID=UPI0025BB61D3|nr:PIG-L family deacetylase [Caldivirga sp.]
MPTLLYIAPHPDDECDNGGGLLAMRVSEGYNVYVVYMTDGRLGSPKPEERGEELARRRIMEAEEALKVLGIPTNHAFFLNYPDGELSSHIDEAVPRIINIISRIKPDEVVHPSVFEVHMDHWAAGVITIRALKELGIKVKEYSYLNYEPNLERFRRNRRLDVLLKLVLYRLVKDKSRVITFNISQYRQVKHECMRKHESQYRYLSKEYIDKYFNTDYESYFIESE